MTPNEIIRLRNTLGMTQSQLATLLGVHAQTVYRWETNRLDPTRFQAALLEAARQALKRYPKIGRLVTSTSSTSGAAIALYQLLRAAYT